MKNEFARLAGLEDRTRTWFVAEAARRIEKIEPDLDFADQFASSMRMQGRPMSVEKWVVTMRAALGRNIGEPESTRYNKFNLVRVEKALRKFESLITVTPARDIGPVVYVTGPHDVLLKLLKQASRLKTSEAELEEDGKLRLAWW